MRKNGIFKKCNWCKQSFYVKKCLADKKFYCSKDCYSSWMKGKQLSPSTQFRKGAVSWNKGTKGVMKPNKTSFKKGKNHFRYKGKILHQGYVLLHKPTHPYCDRNGYVKRSRLIMEKHLARYLLRTEIVHHINHIRDDDRFKNLKLFPNRNKHQSFHESVKHN